MRLNILHNFQHLLRRIAPQQMGGRASLVVALIFLLSLPIALSAHDHSDHKFNTADCQLCSQLNAADDLIINSVDAIALETASALYLPAQKKRLSFERIVPASRGPPSA